MRQGVFKRYYSKQHRHLEIQRLIFMCHFVRLFVWKIHICFRLNNWIELSYGLSEIMLNRIYDNTEFTYPLGIRNRSNSANDRSELAARREIDVKTWLMNQDELINVNLGYDNAHSQFLSCCASGDCAELLQKHDTELAKKSTLDEHNNNHSTDSTFSNETTQVATHFVASN